MLLARAPIAARTSVELTNVVVLAAAPATYTTHPILNPDPVNLIYPPVVATAVSSNTA